ncbi:MAG TPA: Na/Pi symporter [Planctomycetota bacterium]|nr:Na/Pi symporter [Planctomycetota bacterium]
MKSWVPQIRPCALALTVVTTAAGLAGCRRESEVAADRIELVSGNNQAGAPGATLSPLVVRVVSARSRDVLGRRGPRLAVPGVPVTFRLESPRRIGKSRPGDISREPLPADGNFPEERHAAIQPSPGLYPLVDGTSPPGDGRTIVVETDAMGLARAGIRLGSRNGASNIEASIEKKGEKVRFGVVSGVETEVSEPESIVGAKVPIRLRLVRYAEQNGKAGLEPLPDRQIVFQIVGEPPGAQETASLKDKRNFTDSEGGRETEITLGNEPGTYQVLAEVDPHPGDEPIPAIILRVTALDWAQVGWRLATGILVFVFGVRLLGNGFLLVTSPYMHLPAGPWAQNRLKGYLGGLLAGVTFQSASLATSHLMNLTNGGLLTAVGALGLVLGANVGGSLLPQILCLDIDFLAAPFLALGLVLILVPRRVGLVSWSWVLLGAGLVLGGWGLLQHAADLASLSGKLKTEVLFGDVDTTLLFSVRASRFAAYFLLGLTAAFILRTSNLVVVLAVLLATRDIFNASTAVPIVLGANLGSAGMIFLLTIGKRCEARRLALANLVLHVLGCAVAVALYFPVIEGQPLFLRLLGLVMPGRLLTGLPGTVEAEIATVHTAYNFFAGIVFLAFPGALLAIVNRVFPSRPATADVKPFVLDRNLISVPALALRQAAEEVIYLTEVARKTVAEAFDSFRYNDLDLSEQIVRRGEVIAEMHREVSQYLVEVCENQLSRRDASQLEILQTAASAIARIGELGERLRDLTSRRIEEQVPPSVEVDRDLNEAYDLIMAQFTNILTLLRQRDTKTEENAVKMVERIAKISSRVESQWRQRIEQSEAPASPVAIHLQTVIYQEAFSLLFRVSGQLAHIAHAMRILAPERF